MCSNPLVDGNQGGNYFKLTTSPAIDSELGLYRRSMSKRTRRKDRCACRFDALSSFTGHHLQDCLKEKEREIVFYHPVFPRNVLGSKTELIREKMHFLGE
jgi:hypothetical protein